MAYVSKDQRNPISKALDCGINTLISLWFLVWVGVLHATFSWSLVGWTAVWEGGSVVALLILLGLQALAD